MKLLWVFGIFIMLQQQSFRQIQYQHSRVKSAYETKESVVKAYFKEKDLNYKGFNLFIRAFKKEMKLEIWVKENGKESYVLLHTYNFCSSSGTLGPKRREGDGQIPEGVYYINNFNPQSNFYLSLGINYPNASDKMLSDAKHPGSAIYIHGNCVTIGCIPITDDKIKELYILAVEARSNGQEKIPVHIFPSVLSNQGLQNLRQAYSSSPPYIKFWENLQPIYLDFEHTKMLKKVKVDSKGNYSF